MRNYFFVFAVLTVAVVPDAIAGQSFGSGRRNECHYITNTGKKSTGDNWTYYYCGKQAASCYSKKSKSHDKVYWQYHGYSFTWGGNTYWCCNGTTSAEGKYFQGAKWIVSETTKEKKLATGTCDIKIKTNICGGTEEVDCDTPGKCNPGYIMRNGVCTPICPTGQAFESNVSNNCVECATDNYQGIKGDEERGICIKCDKATQFFDKSTKQCKAKSEFVQISKLAMKQCWRCPDKDAFSDCVDVVQGTSKKSDAEQNDAEQKALLQRCNVNLNVSI